MANITLSIPEDLLKQGRDFAKKRNTSLNSLIRELLQMTIIKQKKGWLQETFKLADRFPCEGSKGKRWKREELYDV